jgi:hypothetical protein
MSKEGEQLKNTHLMKQIVLQEKSSLFDRIWNNINRKHISIYDKVKRTEKGDRSLLSSDMMYVCKKYGIS